MSFYHVDDVLQINEKEYHRYKKAIFDKCVKMPTPGDWGTGHKMVDYGDLQKTCMIIGPSVNRVDAWVDRSTNVPLMKVNLYHESKKVRFWRQFAFWVFTWDYEVGWYADFDKLPELDYAKWFRLNKVYLDWS